MGDQMVRGISGDERKCLMASVCNPSHSIPFSTPLNTFQETLVGDQMVRGVSGGERKRLTAAEVLVGASNIYFMDEISTGLDSATLFTIIKWVSHCVHTLRQTALISLLQPPPETFQLFDDVIMITEGEEDWGLGGEGGLVGGHSAHLAAAAAVRGVPAV